MRIARTAAAVLLAGLLTAACAVSGNPVQTPTAPASGSATTSSPTAAPSSGATSPSAPQTSTVTVVQVPTSPGAHRTVTRTITEPDSGDAPKSRSQMLDRLANSTQRAKYHYFGSGSSLAFDAPSNNIACYIAADYVGCSIHDYDFPQPGPDCDAGIAATLDSHGNPALGDCSQAFSTHDRGSVLPYGDSVAADSYACVSEPSGVSCLDRETGTGFTLSRQAYTPVY